MWCGAESAVYKGDYWTANGRSDGLVYYYMHTVTSSSTLVSGSVYSVRVLYENFLDGQQQLITHHGNLRMRIYSIPSRDLLVCKQ